MARRANRLTWLAAPALLLPLVTGCGPQPAATSPTAPAAPSPPATSSPAPAATAPSTAPSPKTTDVDRAAVAAVQALLRYDTRVDRNRDDTTRRAAAKWLSPNLAASLRAASSVPADDAQWRLWARRGAAVRSVEARVVNDDRPPDTLTSAWRQVEADVHLSGRAGWRDDDTLMLFVQMTFVRGEWRVQQFRLVEA